jgi:hypothetical protein
VRFRPEGTEPDGAGAPGRLPLAEAEGAGATFGRATIALGAADGAALATALGAVALGAGSAWGGGGAALRQIAHPTPTDRNNAAPTAGSQSGVRGSGRGLGWAWTAADMDPAAIDYKAAAAVKYAQARRAPSSLRPGTCYHPLRAPPRCSISLHNRALSRPRDGRPRVGRSRGSAHALARVRPPAAARSKPGRDGSGAFEPRDRDDRTGRADPCGGDGALR